MIHKLKPEVTRDEKFARLVGGIDDHRLNTASSCIGCHIDGMNRSNNDLRDWLDAGGGRLPKGQYGVDGWIKDDATVARVRELYPPSSKIRVKIRFIVPAVHTTSQHMKDIV